VDPFGHGVDDVLRAGREIIGLWRQPGRDVGVIILRERPDVQRHVGKPAGFAR